jgi:hypothetical protein
LQAKHSAHEHEYAATFPVALPPTAALGADDEAEANETDELEVGYDAAATS